MEIGAQERIAVIYSTLARAWGRQHWWPASTRFEVVVGAYLTQNTTWGNVETALTRLRAAQVLNVEGIRNIPIGKLETLIRSSGYFRQKAARLKTFVRFLDTRYGGSLNKMFAQPTTDLRDQLLSLNGVGPETADSILLYAGQHPIFVVDAYTRRIAARHNILSETAKYDDLRLLVERALADATLVESSDSYPAPGAASHKPSRMSIARRPPLTQVFNEMHSLLVGVGKRYCLKSVPRCDGCPLQHLLPIRE